MTFQAIRDLHTQQQSSASWEAYLASRKALKNRDRASPSEDADLHRASLVQKKVDRASHSENSTYALQCGKTYNNPPPAGEAGKVGHNKCCDKKGKS